MIHIPYQNDDKQGPLVTYVISTYNRPEYLAGALGSALGQDYRNLQVIVVRDGGKPVRHVVESFNDPRVKLIDRAENHGLCYSYNEAMKYIQGKYVAYLGDDDIHYPNHISKLVETLEGPTDCQAAYSDLYCVVCKIMPDGERVILAKSCIVSRDYDWMFMMQHNPAPGGSTLHRTDLYNKTGPFNENITVLIDWDMARRMSFFTDFAHVRDVTGEFYTQINQKGSDRISDLQRKDQLAFSDRCRDIIWSRPAKPWPRATDTAVVYLMDNGVNKARLTTVRDILQNTFIPYQLYLPIDPQDLAKLDLTEFPPIQNVPVSSNCSQGSRVDAAVERCDADFVAIVPSGLPIGRFWLENAAVPLMNSTTEKEGFVIEDGGRNILAAVVRKSELIEARKHHSSGSPWKSMEAYGIKLRKARAEELPLAMDAQMAEAGKLADNGSFGSAGDMYRKVAGGESYMSRFIPTAQA
ncbi:MAG TPA: glycosyltransferase family 2 protein, partial [Phycisphaerae bacterium]|nr:glycosyltransferase family 2 protein [Phycisphaerae bacterium]